MTNRYRALERHLPYRITQCYLSHDTAERKPALTPVRQTGTQLSYLGEMEGWIDLRDWLYTEVLYLSNLRPTIASPVNKPEVDGSRRRFLYCQLLLLRHYCY